MKNKIYTLIGLFLLTTMFVACSKDEEPTATSDHPTVAKIKKQEWVITAQTLNGSDVFSSKDICFRDNSYMFKADSVCVTNENTVKCDPSKPGPIMTEWYFNEAYTELTYSFMDFTIKEFTDTKLVLQENSATGAVLIQTMEPK